MCGGLWWNAVDFLGKKKTVWKVSSCAGTLFPSVYLPFCTFVALNQISAIWSFPSRSPVLAVRCLLYSTDPHIPVRAVLGDWWSFPLLKSFLNRRHPDNKTSQPLLEDETWDASDTKLAALFVKCLRMLLEDVCRLHTLQLSFATVLFDGKTQNWQKTTRLAAVLKVVDWRQAWNLNPLFNGQPRRAARL